MTSAFTCWAILQAHVDHIFNSSKSLEVFLLLASRLCSMLYAGHVFQSLVHGRASLLITCPSALHVVSLPPSYPKLRPTALTHISSTFSAYLLPKFRFLWVFPTQYFSSTSKPSCYTITLVGVARLLWCAAFPCYFKQNTSICFLYWALPQSSLKRGFLSSTYLTNECCNPDSQSEVL